MGTEVADLVSQMGDLTPEQKQEMRNALGDTTQETRDRLYMIVVVAFSVVLVGAFATLAVGVFVGAKGVVSPDLILTTFTSVVGFLAGLFAPSPVSTKG